MINVQSQLFGSPEYLRATAGFQILRHTKYAQKCINTFKAKVHSIYGPLAYFSNIFISGKNVVISAER